VLQKTESNKDMAKNENENEKEIDGSLGVFYRNDYNYDQYSLEAKFVGERGGPAGTSETVVGG
jgi:hypothetical protein